MSGTNMPTSMTGSISEPLSLEDQCLLHLICHLEEYLPETLYFLPLHLRRRLLLNLPAADICQLENTPVSAGIDMEPIWQELTKGIWQLFSRDKYVTHKTASQTFTSRICSSIINNKLDIAKHRLYSIGSCDSDLQLWGKLWHHTDTMNLRLRNIDYPVLFRHAQQFSHSCQQRILLSFVVDECQRIPPKLFVQGYCVKDCILWKERNSIANLTLIRKVLSGLRTLIFSRRGEDAVEFILTQVFSNPQPILTRVDISLRADHTMDVVSRFFSVSDNPAPSQYSLPYRGLSTVRLVVGRLSESKDHNLQLVVHCQSSLTSLSLLGWGTPTISLMSILGALFFHPQFRELKLCRFALVWENFSALLPQFLSAPSEGHEKVLILQTVQLSDLHIPKGSTSATSVDRSLTLEPWILPQKDLVVTPSTYRQEWLELFKFLALYNCQCLVRSLTVEARGFRGQLFSAGTIFPTVTKLQHVRFQHICLKHQTYSMVSFTNLFQSSYLKSVHFISCNIGTDGLLAAFTEGLKHQICVGTLEELDVSDNNLVAAIEFELQTFFDVLFSLPQLSILKLSLKRNQLRPQHYSIMYDSWRRNSAMQPMKQLNIHDVRVGGVQGHSQDHSMQLQQMAVGGDFLPEQRS